MGYDVIVCFLTFLLVLAGSQTVTSLESWRFYDCSVPGDPSKHPVMSNKKNILKLDDLRDMASNPFIMYRGSTFHRDCTLDHKHLYRVERYNASFYLFDPLQQDVPAVPCYGKFFVLTEKSYGFVSCSEDVSEASTRAAEWLSELPFAHTKEVIIGVGVVAAAAIVGAMVAAVVVWRRRQFSTNLSVM